jgi:hypothetical protein
MGDTKDPPSETRGPAPPPLRVVAAAPLPAARLLRRSADFPLECAPVLAADATLQHDGDYIVATSHTSGREARLNATGAFILSLCDGEHAVAEIARQLAERDRLGEQQALADVRATLRSLAGVELIT